MPTPPSDTLLSEEDYGAIASAVMETARGRWFLAEYARRNRNADTRAVLDAMSKLEAALGADRSPGDSRRLHFDLADMANAIARTKAEIAAIKPEGSAGQIDDATNELDAIVRSTQAATEEILAAAEHLQEVAWTLRERGIDGTTCDIIDQRSTDIYTACSFQDLTGQRTQKVIQVLRYLEDRLAAMLAIWGAAGPQVPAPPRMPEPSLVDPSVPDERLVQSHVDAVLAASELARLSAPSAAAEPSPRPIPLLEDEQPAAVEGKIGAGTEVAARREVAPEKESEKLPPPLPIDEPAPPLLRPAIVEADISAPAVVPASPFSAVNRPAPRYPAEMAAAAGARPPTPPQPAPSSGRQTVAFAAVPRRRPLSECRERRKPPTRRQRGARKARDFSQTSRRSPSRRRLPSSVDAFVFVPTMRKARQHAILKLDWVGSLKQRARRSGLLGSVRRSSCKRMRHGYLGISNVHRQVGDPCHPFFVALR